MKDLWVPISGAIAQQKKVDNIANNVANANTPGFKKDRMVFKEYLTAQEKGADIDLPSKEWAPEDFYRTYGAEQAQVQVDGSFTIHEQGQLTPTGNPLDIALKGQGLIEVLTPNGIRYTRKGLLGLNKNGLLVTHDGNLVLKNFEVDKDNPNLDEAIESVPKAIDRTIQLNGKNVAINIQGEIFVDNNRVAALSVVDFKDIHALKKEGNSLFINEDINNLLPKNPKVMVHQGFIEESNVNAIEEMSSLIKAHRQFDSIQKVIKAYDNISGRGVNEISKF